MFIKHFSKSHLNENSSCGVFVSVGWQACHTGLFTPAHSDWTGLFSQVCKPLKLTTQTNKMEDFHFLATMAVELEEHHIIL